MKKNICFVLNNFNAGGAERNMLELAIWLKARSHQVRIVALSEYGALLEEYKNTFPVTILVARTPLGKILQLRKSIKSQPTDVFFGNMLESSAYLCLASLGAAQNDQIRLRLANNIDNISGKSPAKRRLYRYVISNLYPGHKIVANSEAVLQDYKTIAPDLSAHVIRNPIDVKKFSSKPKQKSANPREIRIISVARHHPQKNLEQLVFQISSLKAEGWPIHLRIVIGGELSESLIEYADEEWVEVLAPPQTIPDLFYQSDVFALFPFYEGYGNVFVEALAAGLLVATWDCKGGMPENFISITGEALASAGEPKTIYYVTKAMLERCVEGDTHVCDFSGYDFEEICLRYEDFLLA